VKAMVAALVLAAPAFSGRPARSPIASGMGTASATVSAPVSLMIRSYAANVEVVASAKARISVTVVDRPAVRVALVDTGGDRIEPEFAGKRQLHDGTMRVSLPRGSAIEISTVTGRVAVSGLGGSARIRGMSGPVKLAGADEVDVETVDGAVEVTEAAGQVRVHTTSGSVLVVGTAPPARLEVETASGQVDYRGPCARGCHLDVDSVSGDVRFALDAQSSFSASAISTSGRLNDALALGLRPRQDHAWVEGRYGDGEGLIECETFSGNIEFRPR
jgi:putative adhesin